MTIPVPVPTAIRYGTTILKRSIRGARSRVSGPPFRGRASGSPLGGPADRPGSGDVSFDEEEVRRGDHRPERMGHQLLPNRTRRYKSSSISSIAQKQHCFLPEEETHKKDTLKG